MSGPGDKVPTSWPRAEGPGRCQVIGTPYEVQCVLAAPHPDRPHHGIVYDSQGVGNLFWGTPAEVAAPTDDGAGEVPTIIRQEVSPP